MRTIVWFRDRDLRTDDDDPLGDAADQGEVIPLFVLDPRICSPSAALAHPHRTQFLLESLSDLSERICTLGSRLLIVSGPSAEVVPRLRKEWQADQVFAYRQVEPEGREVEACLQEQMGDDLVLYGGETLMNPGTLRTGAGHPYSVFTYFARAFRQAFFPGKPAPRPTSLPPLPVAGVDTLTTLPCLKELGVAHNVSLQKGGERAAQLRLRRFLQKAASAYDTQRDYMDLSATSRLSADLRFGTLSIQRVWHAMDRKLGDSPAGHTFRNQLIWREFSYSTLFDRPELLSEPFKQKFKGFPWRGDESPWQAWVAGTTGYPVVDAAARQLPAEGFVHNRARMIAASFLTKHLVIDYRRGEAHYLNYLTDGDPAQNNAGWQWSAGTGCDAQPYFRIFNPVTQGRKFDPTGGYVRRWVPELAALPDRYLHAPWEAPAEVLEAAGLRLGEDYPQPIVNHQYARERYLATAKEHLGAKRE